MNAARQKWREARAERDIERAEAVGDQILENIDTDPRKGFYDDIRVYLEQLRQFPMLKEKEDFDFLFDKFHHGDEVARLRARDLLVYGNIKLVIKIALSYTGRGLPLLDMVQEGVIGLMKAIDLFDIELGYRFSTYAYSWVRQAITRALCDQTSKEPYRIPVHYQEALSLTRRALRDLYIETGRWPKELAVFQKIKTYDTQLAAKLGLSDVVRLIGTLHRGKVELDAPIYATGHDDLTVADITDFGPPSTETIVEARRLYEEYRQAVGRIEAAVDSQPPRSAMVLRLRFGLGDFDPMTLEEIGARYEVTRERIRQIEVVALEQLERSLGITGQEIAEIVDVLQDLEVIAHAV